MGSANVFQHWQTLRAPRPSLFLPLPSNRYTPSLLLKGNMLTQAKLGWVHPSRQPWPAWSLYHPEYIAYITIMSSVKTRKKKQLVFLDQSMTIHFIYWVESHHTLCQNWEWHRKYLETTKFFKITSVDSLPWPWSLRSFKYSLNWSLLDQRIRKNFTKSEKPLHDFIQWNIIANI